MGETEKLSDRIAPPKRTCPINTQMGPYGICSAQCQWHDKEKQDCRLIVMLEFLFACADKMGPPK